MKALTWKLLLCLVPILLGVVVVANAFAKYQAGEGGFNLGTDLVGGTILVYEVDSSRWPGGQVPDDYSVEKLTAKLKQRIDPADLYNVRITPLSKTRIEIVLPTGGVKYAERQQREWDTLISQVRDKWPPKDKESGAYNVPIDQRQQLIDAVISEYSGNKDFKPDELVKFVDANMPGRGEKRRGMTSEKVQEIKELISRVGSLKFVIVANNNDDRQAFDVAKAYFADVANDKKKQDALKLAADTGKPPPPPAPPDGKYFDLGTLGRYNYVWIELGKSERIQLHLDNASENDTSPVRDKSGKPTGPPANGLWQQLKAAREKQDVLESGGNLYFSRKVENVERLPESDREKKYEYFLLTRDSGVDDQGRPIPPITGEYLINAGRENDPEKGLVVAVQLNSEGARLMNALTEKNVNRQMAIVLDDQIQSAPNIHQALGANFIVYGRYTPEEVDRMVTMLRSGALPATLKPQPVSESTMGATLGADTIFWGTVSVLVAFVAILAFMLVYYRFAGIVACVALFANLILTVALMVLINATFTLPGLAGLVLMLGMAVDANVLIYERLREERERGASLALAIRNGYDRAFGVIIDTHLSSIFTAVVLYVVGNDQLKGFGISLTLGLIISLFTSLFMTRLMFDLWLSKGWLHKLSMMKLFSKPNIDFMAIRYYWFTATIILTILGASVFFWRLDRGGLNIDFTGGTAYTGLLKQPASIEELRDDLEVDRANNKAKLEVASVKLLDKPPEREGEKPAQEKGFEFELTYKGDDRPYLVHMPDATTPDEVRKRAEDLPDLSIVQIYSSAKDAADRPYTEGNKSRLFTVRTQERAADLVRAAVGRLLGDKLEQIEMKEPVLSADGRTWTLEFSDYASPAQVSMLLTRQFERTPELSNVANQFALKRVGQDKEGRFKKMELTVTAPGAVDQASVKQALEAVREQLATRPQPERLENFDSQLAADTQLRALYAILASWGAILLYLWFRFGSWTFGLAAVLCLVHDLFFTLGFIGIAHYIHQWWPHNWLLIQDFKIDLQSVAALLTLVGYSVNDTIVVFDRIREVRGKNPELTPKMINDSVNQTLSRTLLTALSVWLVVIVLYALGGEGVHLFAFVMVVGVIVGTYSSIYIASPLLLIFGEGKPAAGAPRQPVPQPARA